MISSEVMINIKMNFTNVILNKYFVMRTRIIIYNIILKRKLQFIFIQYIRHIKIFTF